MGGPQFLGGKAVGGPAKPRFLKTAAKPRPDWTVFLSIGLNVLSVAGWILGLFVSQMIPQIVSNSIFLGASIAAVIVGATGARHTKQKELPGARWGWISMAVGIVLSLIAFNRFLDQLNQFNSS